MIRTARSSSKSSNPLAHNTETAATAHLYNRNTPVTLLGNAADPLDLLCHYSSQISKSSELGCMLARRYATKRRPFKSACTLVSGRCMLCWTGVGMLGKSRSTSCSETNMACTRLYRAVSTRWCSLAVNRCPVSAALICGSGSALLRAICRGATPGGRIHNHVTGGHPIGDRERAAALLAMSDSRGCS